MCTAGKIGYVNTVRCNRICENYATKDGDVNSADVFMSLILLGSPKSSDLFDAFRCTGYPIRYPHILVRGKSKHCVIVPWQ